MDKKKFKIRSLRLLQMKALKKKGAMPQVWIKKTQLLNKLILQLL